MWLLCGALCDEVVWSVAEEAGMCDVSGLPLALAWHLGGIGVAPDDLPLRCVQASRVNWCGSLLDVAAVNVCALVDIRSARLYGYHI